MQQKRTKIPHFFSYFTKSATDSSSFFT
jgi:hypothetical protein